MSLLNSTPVFDETAAGQIAHQQYGLDVEVSRLPSERDQNFLLVTNQGQGFVLKIANAQEGLAMLEAQQQAMTRVLARGGRCPAVIPTLEGQSTIWVTGPDSQSHLAWMVTFLSGRPLADVRYRSRRLVQAIGRGLAEIDRSLVDFDHPALARDFHWDLASAPEAIDRYLSLVADPFLTAHIRAFLSTYRKYVVPQLKVARRMAIHNDANDYNVLVGGEGGPYDRDQQFVGLVDFGDMIKSYAVAEPAVALAYLMLESDDPLVVATDLIAGYHPVFHLLKEECELLYPLALLRLCLSVCLAAHQQQQRPDNAYLAISQTAIRRNLPRLLTVPWGLAAAVIRQACGYAASDSSAAIIAWLQEQASAPESVFAPILETDLRQESVLVLDLGVTSPLLSAVDPQAIPEPLLSQRIQQAMNTAGSRVAVGQYGEPRLIHSRPALVPPGVRGNSGDERCTIHLGLDLFCPAGSVIFAPLAGEVSALADNATLQDFGPAVILRHTFDDFSFFTLYGRLSRESLAKLAVGQMLAKGQALATVGRPDVNGGWPPHLHFQIMTQSLGPVPSLTEGKDDLAWPLTDFPGVAPASQLDVWHCLSPDPNLIVGIPRSSFPDPLPDVGETLAARRRVAGGNLSVAYRRPVKAVRGWRQYLFDDHGRRYLDAYNNVPHVGHCHPKVVAAGQRQMELLNTNTRYLHDLFNRFASRLAATMPDPLKICYFLNSASEANELALRLARTFTSRKEMIVLEAAYHGHTTSLINISPYKHAGPGGLGPPPWVYTAPIPDGYRGLYKAGDPDAGVKYAAHVISIVDRLRTEGGGPASFISETFPSVGGQIIPPPGYLPAVYRAVRAAGGLCIADEVQTGYGRTGNHFYAFEAQGVVPDIVVLGKPIGNGHPIAAVVTTREIAETFDNGMEFFSTFGGNTVSCAVGLSVLEVLAEEALVAHARHVGQVLLEGIRSLADRYELIGDVRGAGLFLGMELVRDRTTLEPATEEASFVADRMREYGVLLGTDGPLHNVIKIRPPMPFNDQDAEYLLDTLDRVLGQVEPRTDFSN